MDSRLIKPKALLLKDYLLDDMSSCSSNGFKSFPRRQCCTSTVRFLIEIDLKNQKKKHSSFDRFSSPKLLKSPSKSSAVAALQTVIAAVKVLPFAASSSPENKRQKRSILPGSLSKKILKKSGFWRRKSNKKEIGRWKSFDQLMKEDSVPLDVSNGSMTTTTMTSDFENSSSEVKLDLPEVRNDDIKLLQNGDVSMDSTTSCNSSNASTNSSTEQKQWSVSEDKEQFSPVSVLECPFDDDEEVSSPFQHRLAHMDGITTKTTLEVWGTQRKLMKKIQRFGSLPQLEPVSLAKQFALLPESDNKSTGSVLQHSSNSNDEIQDDNEENKAQKMALDLHNQMGISVPLHGLKIKADRLLLDFFREKITSAQNAHPETKRGGNSFPEELLEEARNWINERKPRELFLGWEVAKNRQAYIKDMEKAREWKPLDQENMDVALELIDEVFAALMNELLVDISSEATI